ncbi:MAG: TonB-dependent receptor [Bryobacteraceae bacterium]
MRIPTRLLMMLLAAAALVLAQFGTGEISGLITDPSGSAVANAEVKLTNQATGVSKISVTDAQGRFTALDLPAGRYTMDIKMSGFKAYAKSEIELVTGSRVAQNVTLELGSVSEVVEVSASSAQVEVLSATVGKVVEGRMFRDIPLNGRNLTSIMLLKAGVSSTAAPNSFRPTGDARSYTIHGSRATDAYLSTDGVAMTGGRNNLRGPSNISVDAIAEANILTSNYSAEYPRAGGGQVQFVTKSGSRDFHGALYEYLRNDAFDARSFQRATKQKLRYNQFGFALGGPMYLPGKLNKNKEKLFFFANMEWIRRREERLDTAVVPTLRERQGDFNGSSLFPCPRVSGGTALYPNCTIPASALSANGMALASLYPLPNAAETAFNYRGTSPAINDFRSHTGRVDYNLAKHRLFWRGTYHSDLNKGERPTNFPSPPNLSEQNGGSTGLTLTSTVSPTMLNSFRAGASFQFLGNKFNAAGKDTSEYFRSKSGVNYPYLFGNDKEAPEKVPTLIVARLGTLDGGSFPLRFATPTYQVQNDFTWIKGAHTLKFGGYYEKIQENNLDQINVSTAPGSGNNQNGTFRFAGVAANTFTTGNSLADLLIGRFDSYSEIGPKSYGLTRTWSFEFYIQDSWKITPRLSLEFGLRHATWPSFDAKWGNIAMFFPNLYNPAQAVRVSPSTGQIIPGSGFRYNGMGLPGNGFPAAAAGRVRNADDPEVKRLFQGLPNTLTTTDMSLFQPRFGLAWDPFGKGRTSVRLGGGVFNSRFYFNDATLLGGNPPLQAQAVVSSGSVDNPGGTSVAPLFPIPVTMHDPYIKHPVTYNYSLTLQHELPQQFLLEVGYIGKLSRHLVSEININQLPAGTVQRNPGVNVDALRPYAGYSSIRHSGQRGSSNYNAMTTTVERRFTRGLSLQGAYTWSKSIDFGSSFRDIAMNSYDLSRERGLSDFDRAHIVVISYVYELPFFKSAMKPLRATLGGWQISGFSSFQSGLPASVTVPGDPAGVSGGAPQRPNVLGSAVLSRGERTETRYFNTAAFATPAAGTFGGAGRNIIRQPGTNNFDFTLAKHFPIREHWRVQLRAEMFNALNHLSFNRLEMQLGNRGFGSVTGADPARVIQFAMRLEF